jgi:hypothetical protein
MSRIGPLLPAAARLPRTGLDAHHHDHPRPAPDTSTLEQGLGWQAIQHVRVELVGQVSAWTRSRLVC